MAVKRVNAKVDHEATGASLRARLFGPTELVADGRPIFLRDWPGRKARSLLLLLLDSPRHQLPRDRVLDLLWPEFDPDSAANALYKAIHAVRRVLEPTLQSGRKSRFVETHEEMIALASTLDVWTDFEAFAGLIERAEQVGPDDQRRLYRTALAHVRGEYIADEPYADWVMTRRTGIHVDVARITLRLAALDLDAGESLVSVSALETLLALEPTHEPAQQALMRAYANAGLRSDALKQFERYREMLRREYDEEPDAETVGLARSIRESFSLSPAPGAQANQSEDEAFAIEQGLLRHSVPVLPTPTVGRENELAALGELVDRSEVRLVTVTGTGGVGKTHLVRQLAVGKLRRFPGEIVYVPLAALRDADMLMAIIGAALGLVEDPARSWKDVVIARLRPVTMLLVLDNLEQIIDAGRDLAELIEACPALTILTTSRTPLRIRAEHCFKLDVLPLPPGDASSIDQLRAFGATALFLQTYEQLHQHRAAIADDDLVAISAICRRLDGLPLAIEIAASQCYERTPGQIFAMLQERARLYVLSDGPRDLPERHRTLLDLIEWSYELLGEDAKRVFRTMSVFAGGIEQDALTAVAGEDAWRIASELADHNLVSWSQVNGTRRLEMLETVREVAQVLLDAVDSADHVRDRHLAFYTGFANESESGMRGPLQMTYFDRLARDFPNIRAALSFALDGHAESARYDAALSILAGTWLFWYYRGYVHEGVTWLDRVPAHPSTRNLPALRKVYLAQIIAGRRLQDDERVQRFLELIDVASAGADLDSVTIMVKIHEGVISRQNGDLAGSMEQLLDAVQMAEETRDSWTLVEALTELNTTHLLLGAFSSALEVLDRAGSLSREAGDLLSESNALSYRAVAAFHVGEFAQAQQSAIEAERLCRLVENRSLLPWTLYVQAANAFTFGEYRRAIELLQELKLIFADLGNPRNIATVEISLGAAFTAAGELAAASSTFLVAIPSIRQYGFSEDKTMCLFEVAFLASASGQHTRAIRLLAASDAHARQFGQTLNRSDVQRKSAAIDSLQRILGANAFEIEWNAGLNLTLDDAFALAQLAGDVPIELAS